MKKHADWKEVKKCFLFIQDHMIIYIENSMESRKGVAWLKDTRQIYKN